MELTIEQKAIIKRDEELKLLDEPGENIEVEGKKFRCQNQYLLLTYKGHIFKDYFKDWLRLKTKLKLNVIEIAHETGDKTVKYDHSHVVVNFGKNFQTTSCRYFDFTQPKEITDEDGETTYIGDIDAKPIHPHIKKLFGMKAFKDALVYISKEDPECFHLKPEPCWIEGILNAKDDVEALQLYAKTTGDVLGVLAVRKVKAKSDYRVKCSALNLTLRSWQQKLWDIMQTKPNRRDIIWIYDTKGLSGKGTFGDWAEDTNPEEVIFAQDMGTSYHAATILEGKLEGGWNSSKEKWSSVLINLVRSSENHSRMYTYLEDIKDARCTVQKYKGRPVKYDWCHLIVFANYMPIVETVSNDRWIIYVVDRRGEDEWSFDHIKTPERKFETGELEAIRGQSALDNFLKKY